jgi:hypothetical protein
MGRLISLEHRRDSKLLELRVKLAGRLHQFIEQLQQDGFPENEIIMVMMKELCRRYGYVYGDTDESGKQALLADFKDLVDAWYAIPEECEREERELDEALRRDVIAAAATSGMERCLEFQAWVQQLDHKAISKIIAEDVHNNAGQDDDPSDPSGLKIFLAAWRQGTEV